jgi:hypothetical protein
MDFLDRYNRSNDTLCRAVEQTLADAGRGYEVLPGDFSAFIERQRNGKYGLVFWTMELASGDDVKTGGDEEFAREQQGFAEEAEEIFRQYLEVNNGESIVASSGLFKGYAVHLFDSKEALLEAVNAFRASLKQSSVISVPAIPTSVLQGETTAHALSNPSPNQVAAAALEETCVRALGGVEDFAYVYDVSAVISGSRISSLKIGINQEALDDGLPLEAGYEHHEVAAKHDAQDAIAAFKERLVAAGMEKNADGTLSGKLEPVVSLLRELTEIGMGFTPVPDVLIKRGQIHA